MKDKLSTISFLFFVSVLFFSLLSLNKGERMGIKGQCGVAF